MEPYDPTGSINPVFILLGSVKVSMLKHHNLKLKTGAILMFFWEKQSVCSERSQQASRCGGAHL